MKVADKQIQAKLNYLLKNQCVHFMRQLFWISLFLKKWLSCNSW
jgi:hypothetical protein